MPSIFRSHRLADLVLVTLLLLGTWAHYAMPRTQYPEVELNWVAVAVVWPGASAQDVERAITLHAGFDQDRITAQQAVAAFLAGRRRLVLSLAAS